ncbi:MAG: putative sulfate exporter family transporter [Actinobacteria bacterium]|nr:putative sulfate exporter family transporter [Actinomycetota bacterium]
MTIVPDPARLRILGPGIALALALTAAAVALGVAETRALGHDLIEPLVLALLLGVVARNVLPRPERFVAGANLASKQVLEVGVALLGASVDLRQILAAGPALVSLVVIAVAVGMSGSYVLGRMLGLSAILAALVAVGNAICGNSAIAAVAPVLRAEKKDVASAIGLTAVLGVCLVLLLPILIPVFLLSNYQYGILAGMSVYAVPQVIAAAFPVSQLSGEVATLVKLTRVLLLGPTVVIVALLAARRGGPVGVRRSWSTYLPWFVLAFLILAALRSTGVLGEAVATPAREASRWLTTIAMAGLGFGVELAAVKRVGPRVGVAIVLSLTLMAGLTLILLRLLAIAG